MDMCLKFKSPTEAKSFLSFLYARDEEASVFFGNNFVSNDGAYSYIYAPPPRPRRVDATAPELINLAKINMAYEDWMVR